MRVCVRRPNGWADLEQTWWRPTLIHLDPGIVLDKSKSRSEHRRGDNEGAVVADGDIDGANDIGVNVPFGISEYGYYS